MVNPEFSESEEVMVTEPSAQVHDQLPDEGVVPVTQGRKSELR